MPVRLCSVLTAAAAVVFSLMTAPLSAQTVPTQLLVRVLAHDAKIIGSGVGGAQVTVKDARTGAVLASGLQEGGTGNTTAIMSTPWTRGAVLFDRDGTGSWLATLELTEPTWVEVIAEGPMGFAESAQRGSKTLLMVPGVDVRAKVTMLCGCPTEPGGLWDSDRFAVVARLVRDGHVVAEAPLAFAGETSWYAGRLETSVPGEYELQVLALDPERANNGMARRLVDVVY